MIFLYRKGSKMPFSCTISPNMSISPSMVESTLELANKMKDRIYMIEFETLFEYLYLSARIIQITNCLMVSMNSKISDNQSLIKPCYIFCAAVSDFYIPLAQMVRLTRRNIRSKAPK